MRTMKILGAIFGAIWFFPISCTTSALVGTVVKARLDRRIVAKGDVVHNHFKAVVRPDKNDTRFQAVGLSDVPPPDRISETVSFLMPNTSGNIDTGSSTISYHVIEDTGSVQVIEVVESLHDGDGKIWSRYTATRSTVSPISSRMFYFGYMFEAFPYALAVSIIILFYGRFLRRKSIIATKY